MIALFKKLNEFSNTCSLSIVLSIYPGRVIYCKTLSLKAFRSFLAFLEYFNLDPAALVTAVR